MEDTPRPSHHRTSPRVEDRWYKEGFPSPALTSSRCELWPRDRKGSRAEGRDIYCNKPIRLVGLEPLRVSRYTLYMGEGDLNV